MSYDVTKLKKLREETGISFSLCKKALEETDNDLNEAKKKLQKWGSEKAVGKSSRTTGQGAIFSYVHHNKKIASLIELRCETDFVAGTDDFQVLGADLAMQIASTNPADEADLLASPFIKDNSLTIENLLQKYILKTGENIRIGRFTRFSL